ALARKEWDDALLAVAQRPDSDLPAWTAEKLAAEMAPYYAEHKTVVTTPAARSPRHTLITSLGERRWDVEQPIVDPEGDEDWAIYGRVELAVGTVDEAPIVELVRIGR